LKRFRKTDIMQPNQSVTMVFKLGPSDFAFYGRDDKPIVEPGQFNVTVGGQQASFTVQGSGAVPLCSLV
jgi:hypothetical protein